MTVDPNRIQKDYYEGNNHGDYQFTSLKDIIQQFLVVYVGEGKIISKASETDVSFHAQRALQELSFDTFKSIKSQEIVLPPSLQMILPHDYVNYTKVCWSDSSGVEHTMYPTGKTSNPTSIIQNNIGGYDFSGNDFNVSDLHNPEFNTTLDSVLDWTASPARFHQQYSPTITDPVTGLTTTNPNYPNPTNPNSLPQKDIFNAVDGKLTANIFQEVHDPSGANISFGRHYSCWQEINVDGVDDITISGFGDVPANGTGFSNTTIRLGISSTKGDTRTNPHITFANPSTNGQTFGFAGYGPNFVPHNNTVAFIQWRGGFAGEAKRKSLSSIDVSQYQTVFVLVTMFVPGDLSNLPDNTSVDFTLDTIKVVATGEYNNLQLNPESKTWENFKSSNTSETNTQEYDTDNYDLIVGKRYGLDPQHSQVNGSFYIDNLKGLVHFSSNISGKTVILKYISDSLGTDQEMQVHKLAQEALYKHIMYAILSTTANIPEYVVRRYKQERFAATRQAKLRLSNIKLEEITQILRGKSKLIKH